MKIKATLTISKPQGGGEPRISIILRDEVSCIQFFRGDVSLSDFAEAITGFAEIPVSAEVRGLEFVGKEKVQEDRTILCPLTDYSREVLGQWLEENAKEDGWIVQTYLGAKGQVEPCKGGQKLRYSVVKYVDQKP